MEQGKNKNGIIALLVVIIIMLATLCILLATGTISFKFNEVTDNDNTNEVSDKLTVSKINSFIVSDNFISTQNVVASNMPDGYMFLNSGKFAYHNPSFNIRFIEGEENRLISFIGTWSTDGNKLVLNVNKEEYAVGGKIADTPAGKYLTDFTREVTDVNKTIEYTINKIDTTSDYLPFISLSLNNNEVKWYSLPGVGEYLNIPRALAENGYTETYFQLVK